MSAPRRGPQGALDAPRLGREQVERLEVGASYPLRRSLRANLQPEQRRGVLAPPGERGDSIISMARVGNGGVPARALRPGEAGLSVIEGCSVGSLVFWGLAPVGLGAFVGGVCYLALAYLQGSHFSIIQLFWKFNMGLSLKAADWFFPHQDSSLEIQRDRIALQRSDEELQRLRGQLEEMRLFSEWLMRRSNESRNQEEVREIRSLGQLREPSDDTPDEYICPITTMIIQDPVRESGGHCYERAALAVWFNRGKRTWPMTRLPLSNPLLLPTDQDCQLKITNYLQAKGLIGVAVPSPSPPSFPPSPPSPSPSFR